MIYAGMCIIEDQTLVDRVEDWSDVRSPSRAARRRRQGHRQRIKIIEVPKPVAFQMGNTLFMHPITAAQLRKAALTPIPNPETSPCQK
jgi:hypothetical protein